MTYKILIIIDILRFCSVCNFIPVYKIVKISDIFIVCGGSEKGKMGRKQGNRSSALIVRKCDIFGVFAVRAHHQLLRHANIMGCEREYTPIDS
jgi:hypothetical protein